MDRHTKGHGPLIATLALSLFASTIVGCMKAQPAARDKQNPPQEAKQDSPAQQTAKADPPKDVNPPEPPKPAKPKLPEIVRGINFTGWIAGSPKHSEPLLQWAKDAGINTLVLDIKAEDGKLSWKSDVPLSAEIDANVAKIGDLPGLIQKAHDMGFWVVGRVVLFNDGSLWEAKPETRLPGFSGGAYSFVKPDHPLVQQYNLDVAKAAVNAGVDEIQLDYVRYPEKAVATEGTTRDSRVAAVNGFLRRAVAELKPMGVYVSADVFGLTTSVAEGDDMGIGQDYREIAEIVDFISAMAYPSHYAAGTYGIANPNADPHGTVKASLEKALQRTPNMPKAKHRPWIQDFSMHGVAYGEAEVEAQIKALRELGIMSFVIWDPSNKFSRNTNMRVGEQQN